MKRSPSYVFIEVVRSGNNEGREFFTLKEFQLIKQAIGMAVADETEIGKDKQKAFSKILKKLAEIL
jgi:hypothetical protein